MFLSAMCWTRRKNLKCCGWKWQTVMIIRNPKDVDNFKTFIDGTEQ